MGRITLNIEADDVKILQMKDAFEHKYGPKGSEETNREFMERHIKNLLINFTRNRLALKASTDIDFQDPFDCQESCQLACQDTCELASQS